MTGHTGFIGSWLTQWLCNLGAKVVGYSLKPPTNPSLFEDINLEKKLVHIIGNINDQNKVVLIKKGEPFSKKIISSVTHVIGVLEIPEGCVKKLDIKVGDKISWRVVNKTKVKNIRYYHCLDHF